MGVSRDLNDMIRELVWLHHNADYLQEHSTIITNNKAIHNDDIRNMILEDGDN